MGVIIGVDPHKASCTAAVLDERGELVDQQRFASTRTGSRALRRWAKRWPERRWAVEGASGLGRRLAQQLVGDGEPVVDVPAKLAARVRLLSAGHGRKSDAHDAVSVAVAAHGARQLGQVRLEDHATVLRLLSDRRDDLVRAAHPDPQPAPCAAVRPAPRRRQAQPGRRRRSRPAAPAAPSRHAGPDPPAARRRPGHRPPRPGPADHRGRRPPPGRRHTSRRPPSSSCSASAPSWPPSCWARSATSRRFPTKHHFAAHTGTAPIEASSGEVVRHRLSRAGNRKLNHALHLIAIVQIRHPTAGQAYYRRKLAEGKSRKEALRCLKRRLSDAVYRQLLADQQRPAQVQP